MRRDVLLPNYVDITYVKQNRSRAYSVDQNSGYVQDAVWFLVRSILKMSRRPGQATGLPGPKGGVVRMEVERNGPGGDLGQYSPFSKVNGTVCPHSISQCVEKQTMPCVDGYGRGACALKLHSRPAPHTALGHPVPQGRK